MVPLATAMHGLKSFRLSNLNGWEDRRLDEVVGWKRMLQKRSTGVPGAKGRLWSRADHIEPDALGRYHS